MGTLHAASACPWEIMASRLSLRNKDIATGATSVLVPCTTFSLQRFWDDELPYKANGRSCQICAFGHLHLFPLGTLGTKKALAHMIRLHVIPIRTGNNLEGKHLSVGKAGGTLASRSNFDKARQKNCRVTTTDTCGTFGHTKNREDSRHLRLHGHSLTQKKTLRA